MKVGTFRSPLLFGLQFHCLKKGIFRLEASVLLVLVNCPLTLEGQRRKSVKAFIVPTAIMRLSDSGPKLPNL